MKNEKEDKKLKAVAIRKEKGKNGVAKVVASGSGTIAERIVKIAEEKGIDVKKDENSEIVKWEIGGAIPDLTYGLISEILSFVYKLNEEKKRD